MTRRQTEKFADVVAQLGVAAVIGAIGDLVINGTHAFIDVAGLILGFAFLGGSVYLIGLLKGPRIQP